MEIPLLTTKLYIPPVRSELVPRPHLIEQLNAGLQHKLTLISAPAGFGKTTLLVEWLSRKDEGEGMKDESNQTDLHPSSFILHPSKVAWLSLDADDNDPVRFFIYLIAALEAIQPDVGTDARALLQSPQPPPLKTALTMLINSLTAVSFDFVLLLDDYHIIEQQAIHEGLTFLLDHLPPQMHLVIASRADPPLPLARLRTHNQLIELRAAALRFTLDEAVMFLNQAMGLDLSPEDIAALEARTEGWIAGLQLAALSMRGQVTEHAADFIAAFRGSHHHIIDYLAEEVMARQPEEIHDFLCQTSILDHLTAPLCNAVTGREDSETILHQLEHANLFLISLDGQRQWYRYHHLFADFLRSRLHQIIPPSSPPGTKKEGIAELHRRASEWYAQNGLMPPAIDHAISAGDLERAANLIEQVAEATMMRSEVTTLLGWVESLPVEVTRAHPRLCVYHAVILLLNGHPLDVIQDRLQDAIAADTAGVAAGEIMTLRAFIATCQADTRQSAELSQQALELLPAESLFFRSYIAAYMGLPHLISGDVVAAARVFSEAARVGEQAGNLIIVVISLCRLAHIALIQGQLHKAKKFYEQALDLATIRSNQDGQSKLLRPVAGMPLMGLGDLLREWNDLEAATHHLIEGIELSDRWSEIASLYGYFSLAQVKQAQGDTAGARQAIQTARQLAENFDAMEMDDILVATYQVRLWVAQGDLAAALGWVEERGLDRHIGPDELEREIAAPLLTAFEYIPLTQVRLAQGQPDEALAVLKLLGQMAETAQWTGFLIEILALQALAFQAQGNVTQAMISLEQALFLAEPEGYVRLFIDKGPAMAALLRQAAARSIAVDYVGKLLAALAGETPGQEPSPIVHPPSPLVEPLSERELEVLRLTAAGLSNREIAQELIVAVSTVKTHLNNIYRKLDVSSRTQAVARARDLKLM